MFTKIYIGILASATVLSLTACNPDNKVVPRITKEVLTECEGGGSSFSDLRVRCNVYLGIGTTFRGGNIGPTDFLKLAQGKFDLSRSNVVISSTGTSIVLTATTAYGTAQTTVPVFAQGKSARFADPLGVANWLAAVHASSPVVAVDASVLGIEYLKKDGVNAVTLDVVADDGGVTVSTGTYSTYIRPGTITPTPIHNQ